MPSIVQHIVLQRVARLGDDAEALLTVAQSLDRNGISRRRSVLGWDESRLLGVLQSAPDSTRGDTYRRYRARRIASPIRCRREVLLSQLLARRRRQLHQRGGRRLELQLGAHHDEAMYAVLANQFAAAEDWPKAVHYALSAGDWCRVAQRDTRGNAVL